MPKVKEDPEDLKLLVGLLRLTGGMDKNGSRGEKRRFTEHSLARRARAVGLYPENARAAGACC